MSNVTSASETPPTSADNSTTLDTDEKNTLKICLAILLSILIVVVIVGNTLVILAVMTTRRLRTVTNCFVMSLAVADWLVGIFVMPPAVAYTLMGTWELGWILCDVWVSLDILLCTASILSLCAISVDRYLAVTQPLHYSRNKRSKRLALTMILIVWASSALITCPPMFGWYEKGKHKNKTCRYNKNTGYVIFSAMGSFFIPMVVMLYVYGRISCVIAQRHDQLSHMDTSSKRKNKRGDNHHEDSDIDKTSSDYEENNVRSSRNHTPELQQPTMEPPRIATSRSLRSNLNYSYQTPGKTTRSSFYRSSLPSRARLESLHLETLNFESASRVSSLRRETKTAQTLSIVMGGFILCWLPFFIFYLLTPFINTNDVNTIIMQFLTWLGWINSAINPFIYAFYSPDFRLAFWRLTIKQFSRARKLDVNLQHK